jgi:hypothetical protein
MGGCDANYLTKLPYLRLINLLQRRQDLDAKPLPGLQLNLPHVLLGLAQELLQRAGRHVLRDEDHLKIWLENHSKCSRARGAFK